MSRTFIVTETETRVWRVEITDEEAERVLGFSLPISTPEDSLACSAADFTSEPDPERATVTLLSAKTTCETEEAER